MAFLLNNSLVKFVPRFEKILKKKSSLYKLKNKNKKKEIVFSMKILKNQIKDWFL